MRLELPGGDRSGGSEFCALAGTDCRPLQLAPAGESPAA